MYNEFEFGRNNKVREGRFCTAVKNVIVARLLIKHARRVTYRFIQLTINIGVKAVKIILHDHFFVRKVCARWISHLTILT